jgi:predicted nucleotidyltransferase
MKRKELLQRLSAHKTELENMGIKSLNLFGSAARDNAMDHSDIDFIIEFNRSIGVFHFFTVQHRIEEILGVPKVDLVQKGAIHPALRESILAEAIHVA